MIVYDLLGVSKVAVTTSRIKSTINEIDPSMTESEKLRRINLVIEGFTRAKDYLQNMAILM